MWKENIIVLNEEGGIQYIGRHVLRYMNLRWETPFAYPEGKMEEGDLLLYFAKDGGSQKKELDLLAERGLCSRQQTAAENMVLAALVDSQDIKPLVKVNLDTEADSSVCLDTIYERNEIVIRRANGKLEMKVNDQVLSWNRADFLSGAVLVRDRNVKFFCCTENAEDDRICTLLETGAYDAFCDMNRVKEERLETLLDRKVYECLTSMNEEQGQAFFSFGGKAAEVRRELMNVGETKVCVYLFEDEEKLMQKLSRYSQAYKKLSEGQVDGLVRQPQFNSFRLWGNEEKIMEVRRLLQKSSVTNTTILLTGESGTGKTFLAREIHRNSKRKQEAFVHVNCAAIPYQLIESELFGYEEGAFTGALKGGKKGYFEMANGGTLFLDEITEIPITLQGKLLEVLQNKTFYRVGGTKKYESNVRLIAATNRDLKTLVREKRFREDLYYRINVFPVEIPPLRERSHSMYSIVMDLLPDICTRLEMEPVLMSNQAYEKILQYPWPGNIRELENVLEKAVILSDGKIILAEDIMLSETGGFTAAAVTLQEVREQAEKEAIENALQMFHGDKNKAAQYLDIGRSNMFEKVKKYHIQTKGADDSDFR